MKKIIATALCLLFCLSALAACSSLNEGEKGANIRVALSEYPQTLDPALFVDGDRLYLYWGCCAKPKSVWGVELDPADLAPEKTFFDDLGLDSLDMVDLMIGLQRKFGISLSYRFGSLSTHVKKANKTIENDDLVGSGKQSGNTGGGVTGGMGGGN